MGSTLACCTSRGAEEEAVPSQLQRRKSWSACKCADEYVRIDRTMRFYSCDEQDSESSESEEEDKGKEGKGEAAAPEGQAQAHGADGAAGGGDPALQPLLGGDDRARMGSEDSTAPAGKRVTFHTLRPPLVEGQGSHQVNHLATIGDTPTVDEEVLELIREVKEVWAARVASGNLPHEIMEHLPHHTGGKHHELHELREQTRVRIVKRAIVAMKGDFDGARDLLLKACELRLSNRQLIKSLQCTPFCDARVIGRDNEERPVVYICMGSQRAALKDLLPQMKLVFEAAFRLCRPLADSKYVIVADMSGVQVSKLMEAASVKALGEYLGYVFPECLHSSIIVDFPMVGQALWTVVKPLMQESTQKKIAFVREPAARKLIEERFPKSTAQRVLSSFDINRDRTSTPEERQAHARRTAICDVPLGPRQAGDDEAGA